MSALQEYQSPCRHITEADEPPCSSAKDCGVLTENGIRLTQVFVVGSSIRPLRRPVEYGQVTLPLSRIRCPPMSGLLQASSQRGGKSLSPACPPNWGRQPAALEGESIIVR